MKTLLNRKVPATITGILLSTLFAITAHAGASLQDGQSKAAPLSSDSAKSATEVSVVCPDSKVVPITVMKPSLPNGRGALVAVQIGSKRVCHMCPVTTVETTNAWPSHRGPLTKVEVTKTGAAHTCTADCSPTKA